ncbi:MAG: tetratricopeptide repeat protein [Chloroflexota bacterium]
MNPPVILLIEGFAFIVLFGLISLLRREGLSMRFAIETVILTLAASGFCALTGYSFHPVLFLVLIYLITMRVRLLVDLGNIFAQRTRFAQAEGLYRLALRAWPDPSSRLIVQVNQSTACLQQNKLDEATSKLTEILQQAGQGYLGIKYEAAAHYNLGVAYLRQNMDARATAEFNAAIDTFPASEYARRAETALERQRRKNTSATSKEN